MVWRVLAAHYRSCDDPPGTPHNRLGDFQSYGHRRCRKMGRKPKILKWLPGTGSIGRPSRTQSEMIFRSPSPIQCSPASPRKTQQPFLYVALKWTDPGTHYRVIGNSQPKGCNYVCPSLLVSSESINESSKKRGTDNRPPHSDVSKKTHKATTYYADSSSSPSSTLSS